MNDEAEASDGKSNRQSDRDAAAEPDAVVSKSERKRQALRLQKLGEQLTELKATTLAELDLPIKLADAINYRARIEALDLTQRPLISIVMPVYNAPEPWLTRAIESVREQYYPNWELCIADDVSPAPQVARVLAD